MNRRRAWSYRAFAALLGALAPTQALAAERGCPAMVIESDAALRSRFPDLLGRVESELSAGSNLDACARVELRLQPGAVIAVSVALPDGRAASREVTRGDDVVPTLQALLLLPGAAPSAAFEAAPGASTGPSPALPTSAAPSRSRSRSLSLAPQRRARSTAWPLGKARDHLPTLPKERRLGFELSVNTGARIGDGQLGYGVGALSFLEVKSWLFGFAGRVDGYRSLRGGDPETALQLALLTGKRWYLDSVALEVTAGPGVAVQGLAFSQVEVVQTSEMPPAMPERARPLEPNSGPVPRLLLGARLGFSPRSLFRTFVGVDAEVGPTHTAEPRLSDGRSAHLPVFCVGLALGATVGSP